jgi:hypothetical protein
MEKINTARQQYADAAYNETRGAMLHRSGQGLGASSAQIH